LKRELRDKLPLCGAQRMTTLGYACSVPIAAPQDAIEPMRRMCKWIVEESCDPDVVMPLWRLGETAGRHQTRNGGSRMTEKPPASDVVAGADLSGKTCVITGASSGLGRESARAFASVGA